MIVRRTITTSVGELSVTAVGDGADPVLLLWPSLFTACDVCFGDAVEALAEAGCRLVLIDPPGQGRSGAAAATFSMEACADAAFEVLDAFDIGRVAAVLGVSWGGFVALRMPLKHPERIGALVIMNSSAEVSSPEVLASDAGVLSAIESVGVVDQVGDELVAALISPASRERLPELAAALKAGALDLDREAIAVNIRSVLLGRSDVSDALPNIGARCLVIAGALDQRLPVIHSKRMAELLPNAELIVLEGVGHLAPAEAGGSVATEAIRFLQIKANDKACPGRAEPGHSAGPERPS